MASTMFQNRMRKTLDRGSIPRTSTKTYQEAYAEFLRTNTNSTDPAIAFVAGWFAREENQ